MANLAASISEVVEGDDYEITRTIEELPVGDSLATVWLTMKTAITDADPGLFQKEITTTDVPGTGQITDDGAGDATAAVRFDLTPDDTALPTPGTAAVYDIQVLTTAGKVYTVEKGTFTTVQGVTDTDTPTP